jgi:hypothetical protein
VKWVLDDLVEVGGWVMVVVVVVLLLLLLLLLLQGHTGSDSALRSPSAAAGSLIQPLVQDMHCLAQQL